MRINNNINLNFQKRLVARAAVEHQGKKEDVKIFLMDETKDKKELIKKLSTKDWEKGNYTPNVVAEFRKNGNSTYVMENKKGEYIGICQTDENIYPMVNYIETVPKGSSFKNEREYRFVGETFLTFLAKKAKAIGEDLAIRGVRNHKVVKDFYFKHCGFEPFRCYGAILQYDMLDDLINKNVSHAGRSVTLE